MAIAGVAAAKVIGSETAGLVRTVVNALEKPIFSNLETTTVTHEAENGDVIVRTRTKGWTIPLGLVLGFLGAVVVWEVGLSIAKAIAPLGTVINDAAASIANPIVWAYDQAGNLIATGVAAVSQLAGAINSTTDAVVTAAGGALAGANASITSHVIQWDHLDGNGPVNPNPPPTTAKVVAMPASGMAGLSQLMGGAMGLASVPLNQAVPAMLSKLIP